MPPLSALSPGIPARVARVHAEGALLHRMEGRPLTLPDLSAVVRRPRCPPYPKGFTPPRDLAPSELINQDLEALARLMPEAHPAHRESWRRD